MDSTRSHSATVSERPSLDPARVLIAHQSTIPHYRVAFYQAVERLRPSRWSFAVVFDPEPARARRVFGEAVATESLGFPIEHTATWSVPFTRGICYQPFLRRARGYDLVVLEDAFNNLAYPLARLLLPSRVPIAYWGHGRDLRAVEPTAVKRMLERRKRRWARQAAGFFAYTEGVRRFLIENGVSPERIFVLGNTIDVEAHRRRFDALRESRMALRQELNATDARLLLYVGRVNATKRLDLLAQAVLVLRRADPRYRLVLAGGGDSALIEHLQRTLGQGFDYRGVLTEPADLAPLFVASDAFVLPGRVGLAPLTALCYDLTPILIESAAHSPEIEYFDSSNAVILGPATSATSYADAIARLLDDRDRWLRLRAAAWPSIRRLTIDSMARSFVDGVSALLQRRGDT
jgi:glycosyltransferase involved in cell wall biosynthesis